MLRKTYGLLGALAVPFASIAVLHPAAPAQAEAARLACRTSDGQVRDFEPSLRAAALSAFHILFPKASQPPSEDELVHGARFRCGGGKLLACFVGANLPCDRMNADRNNVGAGTFCRAHPQAADVPLVATGHDALYAYRCDRGQAVVAGQLYHLDKAGFAKELWAAAEVTQPPGASHTSSPASPSSSMPVGDPIEERSKTCFASASGQTTGGMTECSHQAYVAYDYKLNQVYQSVLKHVDPASAALIREAQRQWLALQAADQAADNGPWRAGRGSMASPDIEALRIDAIRQRIAKLQYYDSAR